MKQLLMILLLLFATELSAQTWMPNDSSSVGKRGKYTNTTTVDGHSAYKLEATPIIDVSKSAVVGTIATTYADTLNAINTDQSTTLAITSNYIDAVNYSSVTAWLCVDGSYGANAIPIPPYGTYRWAVATATLHYKLDSGTGVIYIIAQ